jgi:putative transposase
MPEYRRALTKGGTYFFTVVTFQRVPIFADDSKVDFLNECIKETKQNYPFKVNAVVILPDHIHTIWTLPDTDDNFSTRWMLIKKRFSHRYSADYLLVNESRLRKREKGIWQRRFWEHLIRDDEDFRMHCDYIHYNPVKHGLTGSPGLWKHSSFSQFVEKGYYSSGWGTHEPGKLIKINYE